MPRGQYQTPNPKATFPTPKYRTVRDDTKRKNAIIFFQYWERLPEALKLDPAELDGKCRVKIYRTWPEVDLLKTDPERKSYVWDTVDGAMQSQTPPFTANDYIDWFLERFYSGGWNCRLYEISSDAEVEVATCYFDAKDMDKYPPRVNLRDVQWDSKANRDYKDFCRIRNIPIPGDAEYQEQQDMTTGGAIIAEAMKQNADLAKENRDILKEALEEAKGPNRERPDSLALEGLRAYTTMITDGAKAAIEIGKSKDMANAKQYDPLEMIEKTMTILGAANNGGGSGMVQLVLTSAENQAKLFSQMHAETLAYMRDRDQHAAAPQAGSSNRSGLELVLEEAPKLEALGKMLGWSRRGGSQEEVVAQPQSGGVGKFLEKLVENPSNLQAITGLAAIIFQGVALMMGKTPPEAAKPDLTLNPKPAAEPVKEEPRQPTQEEKNMAFLEWIEPEFLRHFFDNNLGGAAFAQTFQSMVQTSDGAQLAPGGPPTPLGMQQYGLLRATGPQAFDRLLRSYSPIWGKVQGYAVQPSNSKEPPKYFQFIQDFFSYDARTARQA